MKQTVPDEVASAYGGDRRALRKDYIISSTFDPRLAVTFSSSCYDGYEKPELLEKI